MLGMERRGLLFGAILVACLLVGCGGGGSLNGGGGNTQHIYIDDSTNARIARFDDMTGSNWTTVSDTGGHPIQPFGSGGLDMAKDSLGNLYVLDSDNNHIYRSSTFFSDGTVLSYGTSGSGVGQFDSPAKIAIDAQDRIYILDNDNNRIVRIDDLSGTNWVSFGSAGSGVNQFNGAYGLALDSQGRIYIADTFNNRIVRIDDMTGAGWTTLDISFPKSIVDILITPNNKMLMANRNGSVILTDLMSGSNWTEFPADTAQAVAMDAQGRIYVANQNDSILRRYNDMFDPNPVTFGTAGSGDHQFDGPTNIFITP